MLLEAGIPLDLLRAARRAARDSAPTSPPSLVQPLHAALGVVPDLLRVGDREARERRPQWRESHRHGRVLRERAAAHVDRLVRAAPAPLLSRRDGGRSRWCVELVVVWAGIAAAPVPPSLLRDRDAAPDRHHRHGELRVPQLPRPGARRPAARRPGARPVAFRMPARAESARRRAGGRSSRRPSWRLDLSTRRSSRSSRAAPPSSPLRPACSIRSASPTRTACSR